MKILRLTLDYFCYPIWHDDSGTTDEFGDIDPASLPISTELTQQLVSWAAWFDQGLDMDDPGNSPGMSDVEQLAFNAMGETLLASLRGELGDDFIVNRGF